MLEITEDVITLIMYAMENQNVNSYLDSQTMNVIEENSETAEDTEENRFWAIPPWKSADGFLLMKQFSEQLKNSGMKTELLEILNSRERVFKRFKETVKREKLLEQKWYNYKEKYMKTIILDWFSIYTQAAELKAIQINEIDTDELLLSDIVISKQTGIHTKLIKKWEEDALKEIFPEHNDEQRAILTERLQIPERDNELSITLLALTPKEEPVSFIRLYPWIHRDDQPILWIQMIYTAPEYRGLGLAKLLIHNIRGKKLAASIPSSAQFLVEKLRKEGFSDLFTVLTI